MFRNFVHRAVWSITEIHLQSNEHDLDFKVQNQFYCMVYILVIHLCDLLLAHSPFEMHIIPFEISEPLVKPNPSPETLHQILNISYLYSPLMSSSSLSLIEQAKQKAAYAAVDEFVKDGMVVGVGSGSTVVYAVERIVQRVKNEGLKLRCIPSSFQAEQLIVDGGLVLESLSRETKIDVCIDGADEVDSNLNLIKGGGGCHVQEKIVASCANKFVIIADYRKSSKTLGTAWTKGVPLEVIPIALQPVITKIKAMGGNPIIRMGGSAKAGPAVSDNGNILVDAIFGAITDPATLHAKLLATPGVVDTGLFIGMACKAYFGQEDGSVTTQVNDNNVPFKA